MLRNPLPCTLKENNAKIMSLEAQLLDERAREQQGKKEQTEQIKALKLEIKAHKEKADKLSLFLKSAQVAFVTKLWLPSLGAKRT